MPKFTTYLIIAFFWLFGLGLAKGQTDLADSLKMELIRTPSDSIKVDLNIKLSNISAANNFDEATKYATDAIIVADRYGNPFLRTVAYNNLGKLFLSNGSYDLAANFFEEALELAKMALDQRYIGRILFNLGSVKLVMENYSGAMENFEESRRILEDLANINNQVMPLAERIAFLTNLAVTSYKQGLFEKAIEQYMEGLNMINGDPNFTIQNLQLQMGLGEAYYDYGIYEKALESFINGREEAQKLQIATFEGSFLYGMGKAKLQLGRLEEAIMDGKSSYSIALASNFLSLKRHATEVLHDIYAASNQSDSALHYLTLTNEYKEELNIQEAEKKMLSAELRRNFEERELEMQTSMKRAKINYLTTIVVTFLGAGVMFFLYVLVRKNLRIAELKRLKVETQVKRETLEKEALQVELEVKDKELMKQTMRSIKQNELIGQVVDQVKGNTGVKDAILSALNKTTYSQGQIWDEFEVRFQNVHQSFFTNLLESHPNLTSNERRLCAFLRLDMSTKEISALTGQSIRAIELGRIRLRKKLNLTNKDTSLFEYISQF